MNKDPTWDGTYYGELEENQILFRYNCSGITICFVSLNGKYYYCIIQSTRNSIPCVADEIRPLFGLKKLGSHTVNLDKKLKVIYNLPSCEIKTLKEMHPLLNTKNFSESEIELIKRKIQLNFIFKILLSLASIDEKSIIFCDNDFYSINNNPAPLNESTLNDAIFYRYFQRNTNEMIVNLGLENNINEIKQIIRRIDKSLYWMLSLVELNKSAYS